MASRNLDDLQPNIKEKALLLIGRCSREDLDILIYCTFRPLDEQARLFRQGRTLTQIEAKAEELKNKWGRSDLANLLISVGPQNGRRVTFAGPGQSMHNYGLAFDGVPLRGGKPVWQTNKPEDMALWEQYGHLGVEIGLEWAGSWSNFREYPHMQEEGSKWRELIRDTTPLSPPKNLQIVI